VTELIRMPCRYQPKHDMSKDRPESYHSRSPSPVSYIPDPYGSLSPLAPGSPSTKRKEQVNDDADEDLPEPEKVQDEPTFHPLHNEDAPRITLLSNDGQKFSVDREILSTNR
jgi:hypothetical protein